MKTPIFIEDSKLPVLLSYVAPIDIWAISIGPFVWCRGKLSPVSRRHETIHYRQQLELLFVGHWLLYGLFWLKNVIKHRDGRKAYHEIPFEKEAYANEMDENYLDNRELYAWKKYV